MTLACKWFVCLGSCGNRTHAPLQLHPSTHMLPTPLPRRLPRAACRPTERSGKLTYAAVMEHEWGRAAGIAVRVSIVGGSAGFLVLYLIVLADLLVGASMGAGAGREGGREGGPPVGLWACRHLGGWHCAQIAKKTTSAAERMHGCCSAANIPYSTPLLLPQARSTTAASFRTCFRTCPTRCRGTCGARPC